ncbi:Rv3235 family protein [Actinomycetospora soli]|uniref:Rv3235 family protein n=1 Tax=Actinomycetospora soli TaxID=2893887 RepID=UPI001E35EC8D|nr:Rv3235 family protein [Actinomycetospora soli]MCD2189143.1 Rv3235 family protein [Actinomycetospora soli]
MSVAAHEPGPASTGGGSDPVESVLAGVRPRAGRVCVAPRLARRMDRRPTPRLRVLPSITAVPVPGPAPAPPPAARDLATPAWEAALDAARDQVGPVALRVLSAVAEVIDGRRPVGHLAGVCPAEAVERVGALVPALRRPATRGTRVRGLRMCPLVTTGPAPVVAVEVAAALCAPGPGRTVGTVGTMGTDRAGRARAVAARFERRDDEWRLTELVVG